MKIRQSKFTRTQGKGLASSPKTPWKGGREGRTDRQTHSKSCPAYAGFQILIEKITEHFFFTTKLNRQLTLHSSSIGGRDSSLPAPSLPNGRQIAKCCHRLPKWRRQMDRLLCLFNDSSLFCRYFDSVSDFGSIIWPTAMSMKYFHIYRILFSLYSFP